MTEFVWSQVRDDAVERFNGQLPGAQLEQEIIDVFERAPQRVVSEIERVAAKLAAGKVNSAWPILKLNLGDNDRPDLTVTDTSERDKCVRRAEQWIRNAGCHYDRESEVLDELYSPGGFIAGMHGSVTLAPWADDELLRARMTALWAAERPRGERVEREMDEVAATRVALRRRLLAAELERRQGIEQAAEPETA